MILKINKSDYGEIVQALMIASATESDANKRRKYNLTRKKISRQNEILLKKNKDRRRNV